MTWSIGPFPIDRLALVIVLVLYRHQNSHASWTRTHPSKESSVVSLAYVPPTSSFPKSKPIMAGIYTTTYFTYLSPGYASSTLTTETVIVGASSPLPSPSTPVVGTNSPPTSSMSTSARTSVAPTTASTSGATPVKPSPVRTGTVVGAVSEFVPLNTSRARMSSYFALVIY